MDNAKKKKKKEKKNIKPGYSLDIGTTKTKT